MTTPKTDEELDAWAERIRNDPSIAAQAVIELTVEEKERMGRREDARANKILEEGRSQLADHAGKQGK